jgi:hypothetical protein
MAYADVVHPDAPIIRSQASGSYWLANGEALGLANTQLDYGKIGPVCVVKVNQGDYRLWCEMVALEPNDGGTTSYTGQTGLFDGDTTTAYATSTDGTTWTFRDTAATGTPDTIINPNSSPGSTATDWMRGETSPGTVLWDAAAGVWTCWGHGGNNTGPRQLFYATSTDGITGWAFGNSGAPILSAGASGAWDDRLVADVRVIKISPTSYVMLYRGHGVTLGLPQIGRATSSDGISWTKTGTAPVLASGIGWEAFGIYPGGLIYDPNSGHMHLWYGGDNAGDNGGQALGYAWSDDLGVTWTRSPNNPVLSLSAAGLDSALVGDTVCAYRDGNTYRISWGAEKPTPNGLSGYFRGRLEGTTPAAPVSPDLVGVGTAAWTATSGASFSPGLPTGWAVNDVLCMILHVSSNGTFVVPAGWTKELPSAAAENNTTGQHVEIWWKWAVTGESAPSISLASNAVTIVRGGVIFAVRGCPVDRSPFNLTSRQNNAANTTVNTTNISPATTPTLGIFAYAYEDDPSAATTPTGPTDQVGWTAPTVQTTALGNDASIGIAYRKWDQTGSYLTPSMTVSGGTFAASPNVAFLLAFDPVDVGPFPVYGPRVASEMTPLMPILVQ